jgi:hypothetical protein
VKFLNLKEERGVQRSERKEDDIYVYMIENIFIPKVIYNTVWN